MPRLDSEGRITIPADLRSRIAFPYNKEIALCFEDGKIIVVNENQISEYNVIAFRKVDQKGRIFFPKEALELLGASHEDFLVVSLFKERIRISKV